MNASLLFQMIKPLSKHRKVVFCFSLGQLAESSKEVTRILTNVKELHIISNGKMPIEKLREILIDIHPYVTSIHLREKQKTARELFQAVDLLSKDIPLSKIIINDRVDVAFAAKVAGVQLAYHSLDQAIVKKEFPNLRVGSSIHSYQEGENALRDGADYVLFGHLYPSRSKPGKTPKGIEELSRVAKLSIPVIAIGGITPENTKPVIQAGANGIAVMSGVLDSSDPILAVKAYVHALKDGDGKR